MTKSKYILPFIHFFSASFIVRLISLGREVLLVSIVGPGKILDLYFFLISIPNLIVQIWNAPLESVLLTKYEKNNLELGNEKADNKLNGHVTNLTIVSIFIFLLANIIFPVLIYLFYRDYFSYTVILSICIINIIIIVETYLLTFKVFNLSQKNFFLPAILPVFQSISVVIALIWFGKEITIFILSIFFAIGSLFQITIFFKNTFLKFFVFRLNKIKLLSEIILLKDSSQLSLAMALSTLNLFIDQNFALSLGPNSNSYLHYGYYFLNIFSFLFIRNINTILFPQFQKYVVAEEQAALSQDVQKILKSIFLLCLLVIVVLINNGYFILEIIIGYGKVSHADLQIIYYTALGYSGTIIGVSLNSVITRILIAHKKYAVILKVSILSVLLNTIFNIIFSKLFGVWGIAISTSLSFIILVLIYFLWSIVKLNVKFFNDKVWYFKYVFLILVFVLFEYILINNEYRFLGGGFHQNLIIFISTLIIFLILTVATKLARIKNKQIIL